jgi:hypothetical protein
MSLSHIEGMIGALLPKGAGAPAWWSDDPRDGRGVQHQAWLSSGFTAVLLPDGEHVRFARRPA